MSRLPVLGLGTLWHFYRARLRNQAAQELLAGAGIAAGVALIFAVQIANASVTGSVAQLIRGVTGDASLQVAARGDTAFGADVAERIASLPDVRVAAPALDRRVVLVGPRGERTVDLLGVTPDLAALRGRLMVGLGPHGVRLSQALVLPQPLASAIGARVGEAARVRLGGVEKDVAVSVTVPADQYGDLARSPVALAPLDYVQRLTGLEGRISRVLVSTTPGREHVVRERLRQGFGRTLDVVPADREAQLIRQAAAPSDQSTRLFAAISALVGALFAFTAMLLTVPERRRFAAELRLQGFSSARVTAQVAFESLLLGIGASAIGLVLGDQLSRHAIEPLAGALAFAFPVGDQRVVTGGAIAVSLAAGVLVTLAAGARPLGDIVSGAPPDAPIRGDGERPGGGPRRRRRLLGAGLAIVAVTTALVLVAPALTVAAPAGLAIGLLLALPAAFCASVQLLRLASRRTRLGLAAVAASELAASPTRSIALACTVALALFGNVAIEGAHRDLLRGLDQVTLGLSEPADVWVIPSAAMNTLATVPLADEGLAQRVERAPRVARAESYRSAFLDVGERRLWVIGRPAGDPVQVPANQVVGGDAARTSRRLRAGGWAAVTAAVADERGLRLGRPFTLPTPAGPQRFRLAARITNFGWAPGTIIIGAADHRRAWGERAPTAIEVELEPGAAPSAGRAAVAAAIGDRALDVQTADERWAAQREVAREGLSRLSHIATLALLCTIFAVVATTSAGLWQRRGALAELRVQGFSSLALWTMLLIETGALIACGGGVGLLLGLYGQGLAARWLELDTGFPTVYAPAILPALSTLAVVTIAALAMTALPGLAAARTPLRLGFKEE